MFYQSSCYLYFVLQWELLILFSLSLYYLNWIFSLIQEALNLYLDFSYRFYSTLCYYNMVVKLIIVRNNVNAFICEFGRKQCWAFFQANFYYNKCQSNVVFSKPQYYIHTLMFLWPFIWMLYHKHSIKLVYTVSIYA